MIYVMRHGSIEDGSLRDGSAETVRKNAQSLIAKGLGSSAIVLSSTAYRAAVTAEAMSRELGEVELVKSSRIEIGADWPGLSCVRNLDDLFTKALEEEGASTDISGGLVVVAHTPLVAAVDDGRLGRDWGVGYGQMVEYVPGSWPDRTDANEEWLETAVAEALAERSR
jgi:phosphohistidine phosphatase SixA